MSESDLSYDSLDPKQPTLPAEDCAGLLFVRISEQPSTAQTIHIRLQRFDPGGSSSGFVQQATTVILHADWFTLV